MVATSHLRTCILNRSRKRIYIPIGWTIGVMTVQFTHIESTTNPVNYFAVQIIARTCGQKNRATNKFVIIPIKQTSVNLKSHTMLCIHPYKTVNFGTTKKSMFKEMSISSTRSIFYLFLYFFATAASRNEKLSAYEELQRYDFPMGILPKGVKDYKLNTKTGEFSAYLNSTCSFKLENSYQLNYKPVIKGVISKGRLKKLSGVSVKVVLLWLNIVEVKRKGKNLEFSIGLASANFPVENFEECPQCGHGLNCVDGGNNLVSFF